jgi:hypothetical protein
VPFLFTDLDAAAASMKGEVARAPVPEYLNALVTEQLAKTHEKIGLAEERKVVLSLYALAQTSMQALTLILLLSNNASQSTVRWQYLNGFTLGQVNFLLWLFCSMKFEGVSMK